MGRSRDALLLNSNAEQANEMKYSADEEEWESVVTPLIIRKVGCPDGDNLGAGSSTGSEQNQKLTTASEKYGQRL